MNKQELECYLLNKSQEFFEFTFSIVPNVDQAKQIVTDTVTVFLIHESNLVESILSETNNNFSEEIILKVIYKYLYETAYRRHQDFIFSDKWDELTEIFSLFYDLPVNERAILFLRHKAKLKSSIISYIMSHKKEKTKNLMNSARNDILLQYDQKMRN